MAPDAARRQGGQPRPSACVSGRTPECAALFSSSLGSGRGRKGKGRRAGAGEDSAREGAKRQARGFHHSNALAGFISTRAPELGANARLPRAARSGPPPAPAQLPLPHPRSRRSHGSLPPLPRGQKNVFFCIARLAAPGPCAENRRAPERTICSPCRRGAAGAGEHPQPKTWAGGRVGSGASGRKKGSARVIDPNIPSHKTLGPASPWCVAHPDPTLFSLRTAPNTHKGQHTSACGGLGRVCLCVCQRSGESGVSQKEENSWHWQTLHWSSRPRAGDRRRPPCSLPAATSRTLTAFLIPRSVLPSHRAPELGRPVQLAAPEHSPLLLSPDSPPPAPRAWAQRATSPEPAPTSRGGAEERAAGGGAVVPRGQLHAVGEDHPPSGGDGPARGLAAAATSGHGRPAR